MRAAQAGTLSCLVRTPACSGGEIEVFEMQNTANSHAGLPASSYTNLVCCTGVVGLGNSCSGTYAVALKLSGANNAHARQNSLADYAGANNACLSVPGGGSVSVGYSSDCAGAGYDTTLASMSASTNAHVGISTAYPSNKICATAVGAGSLTAGIVDAAGNPVTSPTIALGSVAFSFVYSTANGVFGVSTEKIRVNNDTGNPRWNLTLAAENGPTSFWDGTPADYDFNDPTTAAVDGPDPDSLGGQMAVDPLSATVTPKPGCDNTGVTLGSSASYSQAATDTITLLTAGASAAINCYWDTVGVAISQTIPKEQPAASDYAISLTLTVTAV
ncbi:MAG: hypothetical protein PHT12_02215 [Patescibacteria group bacterium]|nr:hypothetical protein [Patescibacteria group bacterium]